MRNYKLFTVGNPKTLKGEAEGYYTIILHLAPARSSGVGNVCPKATPQCTEFCLNTAGRGGVGLTTAGDNTIQAARRRKTQEYLADPEAFEDKLAEEIHWHYWRAANAGYKFAVRVNGTSDLPALARNIARRFPGIQFYDYTKISRVWTIAPANLHYTFSRSENNINECKVALKEGVNVAVVFSTPKGQPLPLYWLGVDVIDGDKTDLRFLDPRHRIVGLRAKGRARGHIGGFVVQV